MSKLETNTIDTISGTTNLTIGSTNSSTVTFENGSPTGHMYPAFEAKRTSDQSVTDATTTKVQFPTKVFDTDNYYDNTTNYRFTPLVAGKYYVYASIQSDASGSSDLRRTRLMIHKNGSQYRQAQWLQDTYRARQQNPYMAAVIEMNGTTDYLEVFVYIDDDSGNPVVNGSSANQNYFGAYRIGA